MTTYPNHVLPAQAKPGAASNEDFRVTPWILLSIVFGMASFYTANSMPWTASEWNTFVVNVTALVAGLTAFVGTVIGAYYKFKSVIKAEADKTREVVAKIETANPLDPTAFPTTPDELKRFTAAAVTEALKQHQAAQQPKVQT